MGISLIYVFRGHLINNEQTMIRQSNITLLMDILILVKKDFFLHLESVRTRQLGPFR